MGTRAPKTHSVSRSFFDRGVGSSILASLSEAGGNDRHNSRSKPLPPRSKFYEGRHSECIHGPSPCRFVAVPSSIHPAKFPLFLLIFQGSAPRQSWMMTRLHPDSGARNPASGIYLAVEGKDPLCDFVQKVAALNRGDSGGLPFWIQGKQVEPAHANRQRSNYVM